MVGPSKAEVWRADLRGSKGHEQKKARPCIIWRDFDHLGLAIVIPLTGTLERDDMPHTYLVDPNPHNGLDNESIALLFQMTVIDKSRLIEKLGVLDSEEINVISAMLKDMLRL